MDEPFSPSDLLDFEPAISPGGERDEKTAFAMSVEIKDGQVGVLRVRVDDDPRKLATEFAKTHDLDAEQREMLVQYIVQNQLLATHSSAGASGQSEVVEKKQRRSQQVSAKTSVHERLYQYRKRATSPKVAPPAPRKKRTNLNYGNWLYIRGMQSKERLKTKAEQRKYSDSQLLEKELTFNPAIDKISSLMSPRIAYRTEEMLFNRARELREKLEERRSQSEERTMKDCPFRPKINKRKERASSVQPRYSLLFSDASRRSQRRLQASQSQRYSFRPHILPSKYSARFDSKSFLARISQSKRVFTKEVEELKKQVVHSQRSNRSARGYGGLSVHDYLYSLSGQKQEKLTQASLDLEQTRERARHVSKMTTRSEQYLKTLKARIYKRYFTLLDSDSDGLISAEKCDVSGLEVRTVELLSPVLSTLGEMNFDTFAEETESLLSKMSFTDKAYFLHTENKQEHSSESRRTQSVRTSLTSRSSRLDRSEGGDIYSRGMSARQVRSSQRLSEQLQEKQKLQEKELSLHCTFRPFTLKRRPRRRMAW
jgi:hypothetical protein